MANGTEEPRRISAAVLSLSIALMVSLAGLLATSIGWHQSSEDAQPYQRLFNRYGAIHEKVDAILDEARMNGGGHIDKSTDEITITTRRHALKFERWTTVMEEGTH